MRASGLQGKGLLMDLGKMKSNKDLGLDLSSFIEVVWKARDAGLRLLKALQLEVQRVATTCFVGIPGSASGTGVQDMGFTP